MVDVLTVAPFIISGLAVVLSSLSAHYAMRAARFNREAVQMKAARLRASRDLTPAEIRQGQNGWRPTLEDLDEARRQFYDVTEQRPATVDQARTFERWYSREKAQLLDRA